MSPTSNSSSPPPSPPKQQQPQLAAPTLTPAVSDDRNRMELTLTAVIRLSACIGLVLTLFLFFNPRKELKCKLFLDACGLFLVEFICIKALFHAIVAAVLLKFQFPVTGREIPLKELKAGVVFCITASGIGMVSLIFYLATVIGSKFDCEDRVAYHFMVTTVVVANLVAGFRYGAMVANVLGF